MNSYIEEAIKTFVVCPIIDYQTEREEIIFAIENLERKQKQLTPLEKRTSAQIIETKIQELRSQSEVLLMAQSGYPIRFSTDALKLRYADGPNQGLPVFGVYDFNQETDFCIEPTVTIHRSKIVSRVQGLTFIPAGLPQDIQASYKDLLSHLTMVPNVHIRLAARWSGVIPDEVSAAIQEAEKTGLFEKIYLVPQIMDWTVSARKVEPRPARSDPFVIGLHKGTWYLIAKFDPTDLENLVGTQFTTE